MTVDLQGSECLIKTRIFFCSIYPRSMSLWHVDYVFYFFYLIKIRVKYLIGTCGLETLFFVSCAFIRITDGTYDLGKDRINTSINFSVQKLTVGHVSTPDSKHVSKCKKKIKNRK